MVVIIPVIDDPITITASKAGKMILVAVVHIGHLVILRGRLALRLFLVSICRLPSCCGVVGGSMLRLWDVQKEACCFGPLFRDEINRGMKFTQKIIENY